MKASFFPVTLIFLLTIGMITSASKPLEQEKTIKGAWKIDNNIGEQILLFVDGYFTHTSFNTSSKRFVATRGGTYQLNNGKLGVVIEFDSENKEAIGNSFSFTTTIEGNRLFTDLTGEKLNWNRIDDAKDSLAGLWHITARKQGENVVPIHQAGPRKTVKILTGTRFQWAAINPESKEFFGTGGGSYTFKDGKYVEHIEFFSRDSSRVGSSLTFDGSLKNNDWHHSGLSSRGEAIYEVWSRKQ